jgi:hypothetical protein
MYQETANAQDLASKAYESGDKSPHSKFVAIIDGGKKGWR